jgi:hypothetical protein
MRQSPNFRHALTLRPHITLLKSVPGSDLPEVSVPTDPFMVRLMPLIIHT